MTPDDLAKLRALADAAVAGPWETFALDRGDFDIVPAGQRLHDGIAQFVSSADAAFIAASRQAVPALIDRIEELERSLEWAVEVQKAALESQERLALELKDERARREELERECERLRVALADESKRVDKQRATLIEWRAENERLRAVYDVAFAWRDTWRHRLPFGEESKAVALVDAVDAFVAKEPVNAR